MICSLVLAVLIGASDPATDTFKNPPAERRILKIVHGWPGTAEAQDALLQDLGIKGFGGVTTNVSFKDYLQSEESWQSLVSIVERARKAGMALWLYDEKGYPSGAAGGLTLRDRPEWEARGLYYAVQDAEGVAVELDLPPGALRQAVALPLEGEVPAIDRAVDLASSVRDRKLSWQAPEGRWRVVAVTEDRLFDGTHVTVSFGDHIPYINLLMAEPTDRFLELTHDAYAQHFGESLGRTFVSTFTDEPSLMSLFMKPQPWVCVPWSPGFAQVFQARRGYDLLPLLPLLATGAGTRAQAVRYDYWLTVGELVSENFFGRIEQWCDKHDILSGGHLLCEEATVAHVPLYGDFLRCARRLSAPSIDCLTSVPEEVPWYVARLVSSAAELEGRSVTMCETSDHVQRYRAEGDTRPVRVVTEEEIRGTCNRLILGGINTITSYYSFADLSDEQLVRLNEWVGRCAATLAGGHQVADVAVVYPTESLWVRFTPSRHWTNEASPEVKAVERAYRNAIDDLYAARRDFTVFDARALAEAKADEGVLRHGALAPRVVVLPRIDTLPLAAWESLARFWDSGGAVIALGALPANSEKEFPSPRVQEIAAHVFGSAASGAPHTNGRGGAGLFLGPGMEGLLPAALAQLLAPDVEVSDAAAPLRVTHRRIDGREVFFVINDSREAWEGSVAFSAEGAGEMLNPATGTIAPCAPGLQPLRLGPFEGMLYRFPNALAPERRQPAEAILHSISGLPGLLPPTCVKGEFVQGGVAPVNDGADTQWRADASLTKSGVDTFLFACFDFPEPVDASAADWLEFTLAPLPGGVAQDLLVILVDADGREFFAHTGCSTNHPAPLRCCVPLSRFERAGWSKSPEGPLSLRTLKTVRIGWGGRKGKAEERVAFQTTPPRLMRAGRP